MYDGVHRGHQKLIGEAVGRAHALDRPCLLLTFDPHPAEVIRPGSHPAILTSLDRKAELVADLGVDAMCVLPFTTEFMRLSPETFTHTVLVEHLHAAQVVVGENFTYGHRAAGTVDTLAVEGRRFGFSVEGIPLAADTSDDGEVTISSTYIRACVAGGDMVSAARALGRPHRVDGIVVRGDRRGKAMGYPTANVECPQFTARSEEHTSELQSRLHIVCRLLLEKKKKNKNKKNTSQKTDLLHNINLIIIITRTIIIFISVILVDTTILKNYYTIYIIRIISYHTY